jgi:hypothetical protein
MVWGTHHGIYIGFHPNQKGHIINLPHSQTITVSGDFFFHESFHSITTTSWHHFSYSLFLQHSDSIISDPDNILEEARTFEHLFSHGINSYAIDLPMGTPFEEGTPSPSIQCLY